MFTVYIRAITKVHPIRLMNTEQLQPADDLWTKPTVVAS